MKVDFDVIRSSLRLIGSKLGPDYLVSFSYGGDLLKVVAAKQSSEIKPWMMTFDSESDFDIDSDVLIRQFVEGAKAYFSVA